MTKALEPISTTIAPQARAGCHMVLPKSLASCGRSSFRAYSAALPVARNRCAHLTTLATLTPNKIATSLHGRFDVAAATLSRRSFEQALGIPYRAPNPARMVNHRSLPGESLCDSNCEKQTLALHRSILRGYAAYPASNANQQGR